MRPITLEIEGFLSYKEKTFIDFSELSLFAITGATGAGKSSIIDAIIFALYGKCPRFEKGVNKEEYISKGKDFFRISLTFSAKGKIYTIERSLRSGKSVNVTLKENGKEIRTEERNKVREEEIERILDMDYETFTRIIVLPQGDFARFIKPEKPQERRDIIMKLSNLDKIDRIRELASSKKKDIQAEISSIKSRIEAIKVSDEDLEALENILKSLEKELEDKKAIKENLSQRLVKANRKKDLLKELENAKKEYESLAARKDYINKIKERIEFLKPKLSLKSDLERYIKLKNDLTNISTDLSKKHENLKMLEKEYLKLLEDFDMIKKDYDQNKEREARIERGFNIIRLLENAKSIEEYISKKKSELSKIEQELDGLGSKLSAVSKDIIGYEKELSKENIQDIEKSLEELIKALNQLELKEQEFNKKMNEKKRLSKEIEGLENKLNVYKEKMMALEDELNKNKDSIVLYHSSILKTLLKENDICPVCGGIYHEKEHVEVKDIKLYDNLLKDINDIKSQIALTEQTIKDKKDAINILMEEISALENELSKKKDIEYTVKELKQKKAYIENSKESLNKARSEKEKLEELKAFKENQKTDIQNELTIKEQELKALENELISYGLKEELLKDKKTAIAKSQERIEKLKQEIEQVKKNYESYKDKLSEAEKKKLLLQKDISTLESQKDSIDKELSALETKLSSIDDKESILHELNSIEKYEKEYNEYVAKLNHTKDIIEKKEKEIEKIDEHETPERLQEEIKALEDIINNLSKEIGSKIYEINQIKENKKEMESLQKTLEELESKQRIYERLELDLKGDALQAYISQKIIEELVHHANFYASKMDFPYTFKVEETSREKDSIVIEDAFGNIRPIKSLSGGETFITSLCFALALGEVVGSNQLQSLFIDEGFGTLDRETLEKVGNALELLSQNINKMVGIITHVESLAERFPNRIMVTKKDGVSKIDIL